ncbi:MAG TPA: hypothetical protein VM677_30095 [Actinokineospora sp.]|nr:hypothetical protein [Actinokineospora sp.]
MTEGTDWLDRLTEDDPPIDARRGRKRMTVIAIVAAVFAVGGFTVGLLITPPLPECVPLTADQYQHLKDQAADAPPGAEHLLVLTNGGLCGSK